ncbi:MAG: Gx transporter family protein [Lachnospiraceae bacterium]|nr:Gx transporter family protein [Lachnospiraceae bacterium]
MFKNRTAFPNSITRLTVLAVFTVIALTLFVVESAIPVPVPIPGLKLGLANIVTLIVLQFFTLPEALLVLTARILLSAFFAGQALSLLYSFAGGLLSLFLMALLNRFLSGRFLFITGIFGALAHNVGQLIAACLILGSPGVFAYLPFLMISGSITGLFTGLSAHYAVKYLKPHLSRFH